MRIAALYDIHGNLPALDAVLDQVRRLGVDQVVVGGDVLPGPMPLATLERLYALDVPVQFLYGNGEVAVVDELARKPSKLPENYQPMITWNAQQVAGFHERLTCWPKTIRLDVPELGSVLFCHGTPRSEDEIFTRITPEERLLPLFDGLDAAVVVCGHTHMQFDRTVGTTRVINAGSVGMPVGKYGADWLLLDDGIHLRHADYDVTAGAEMMAATACPLAREFFAHGVLHPASEADMLAAFEAVAVT